MRKLIIFIAIFIGFASSMMAQNKFYYSGEKKITLNELIDKCVIFEKKGKIEAETLLDISVDHSIKDPQYHIKVIKGMSKKQMKALSNFPSTIHTESCYINNEGLEVIPTGYINIKLKQLSDFSLLIDIAEKYGLTIVEQNSFMPQWYTLRLNDDNKASVIDIANSIYESGLILSSSPAFSFNGAEISYDPNVDEQWGLYNAEYDGIDISADMAWAYATGRGIKICIVDNGVDITHQDLAANIYMSYDFHTKTSPITIFSNHGTHCAGIVAAVRNNGIQIAGVAPDAKLMAAAIDYDSATLLTELADGINWAWQNGADIISCSWWCMECDIVKDAIDDALTKGRNKRGCIVVSSAGNFDMDITFPANYRKEVIAVANIKKDGIRAESSCYGDNMLVSAPGTDILSTIPNNGITMYTGTSMACPHVSGVAALILERNSTLKAAQVREIIAKSAKQVGDMPYDTKKEFGDWNKYYGYGLVDAYNAVMNTPRK